MALVRGLNSYCPCPVCLIPGECLSELSKTYPLRTTEAMKEVYERAQEAETVAGKEMILKEYSLRDVKVRCMNPMVFLTNLPFVRIFFGRLKIQMSMRLYHGINCTPITAAYSQIICGFVSRKLSQIWGSHFVRSLTPSNISPTSRILLSLKYITELIQSHGGGT